MSNGENIVFIIGFPRSGTTWLQNELSCYSGTFSPTNESFFLSRYMIRLFRAWNVDQEDDSVNGLSKLISEDEFIDWMRNSCIDLFRKFGWDGEEILIEKTPYNIVFPRELHRLFPHSKVLMILREPLEVFKSHKRISQLEWGTWALNDVKEFSRRWNERLSNAHTFKELFGDRFHIVEYQSLKNDSDVIRKIATLVLGNEPEALIVEGDGGSNLLSLPEFKSKGPVILDNDEVNFIQDNCIEIYNQLIDNQ